MAIAQPVVVAAQAAATGRGEVVPFWWDMGVVAVFGLVIYVAALKSGPRSRRSTAT
jgi:hypothetical protein